MHTLIITSTVHVNSNLTVLTDPELRHRQYLESILFYLGSSMIRNIVVCDNSGFDFAKEPKLSETAGKNGKRIEFLYFIGNKDKIMEKGKGYGEGEIMKYIFANSKLLQSCNSFFKITGRIRVLNIDRIIRTVIRGRIYFQKVGNNPFVNPPKVDTRLYYCTNSIFEKYLADAYFSVNDIGGYYLEHAYFDSLKKGGIKYDHFARLPRFEGISGSTGDPYSRGPMIRTMEQIIYGLSRWL